MFHFLFNRHPNILSYLEGDSQFEGSSTSNPNGNGNVLSVTLVTSEVQPLSVWLDNRLKDIFSPTFNRDVYSSRSADLQDDVSVELVQSSLFVLLNELLWGIRCVLQVCEECGVYDNGIGLGFPS